jgi:hypothetical protein
MFEHLVSTIVQLLLGVPFLTIFVMLLELITLDGFPCIPLSSISFPFEEKSHEKFLKIKSHCSQWL